MSLYKRGKTWWVHFFTPSGQRIRCTTGTKDKKVAQEYHDKLKAQYHQEDVLGKKPEYTWQDAVVKWLEEKSHKTTIEQDKSNLKWLDQFLGDKKLSQITRDLLIEIGKAKADETSTSTANRYLSLVRAIMRMARDEWEWIEHAPKVRMYPPTKRRIRWLTREQADLLLSLLPKHQFAMAKFALATGLRQRNVTQLRWSQVDLDRKVAWVHPDQAKARRAIPVALNADALSVLALVHGQHTEYVFTYHAKPIRQVNTKAWKRATAEAGLEDFRWHDLRHTWASWLAQAGTPLNVLQEMGGWSSVEMVRRYAHLSAEHLSPYAERIASDTNTTQSSKPVLRVVPK